MSTARNNQALSLEVLKRIAYAYLLAVQKDQPLSVSRYLDPLLSKTLKSHSTIISHLPISDRLSVKNPKFRLLNFLPESAEVQIRFSNFVGNEIAIELSIISTPESGPQITRVGFGF